MTRREANEAAMHAADRQRRLRTVVDELTREVDAHPHDRHFRNTHRVMQRRLAEAEQATAEADARLREVASIDAMKVNWSEEGRWPGPVSQ